MVKTADRPHIITILISLSAIALSLFSLQQSCSAQRTTKATSRAMLVLKSAGLRMAYIFVDRLDPRVATASVRPLFQVENVGKAIAHNPSLQYELEVNSRLLGRTGGTIKFMDDPPGTPVVGEGEGEDLFLHLDKGLSQIPLNIHYRLSYDDEATGAHFDEKEFCGQFSVELPVRLTQPRADSQPRPRAESQSRSENFPMLPCPPK